MTPVLHTIDNGVLRVSADETGAQLWSILDAEGTQFLWQGDAAYWADRALNLFPFVARLWQGTYTMDGQAYCLPIHGFAPQRRFALEEKTDTAMTFALASDEETYACYPRRFVFRVRYALEERALHITFEVENRDTRTMHFGLGGHPGFNVPLEAGLCFEDYRLRFSRPCAPVRVGFTPDCFVIGKDAPFALEDNCMLPLAHDLFDEDAIVLRGMAREVTLEAGKGCKAVTVSFPDMPYLGIWHWPGTDAPYVCIEPWRSLPARAGEITALETREDLVHLAPGETYRCRWTIRVKT